MAKIAPSDYIIGALCPVCCPDFTWCFSYLLQFLFFISPPPRVHRDKSLITGYVNKQKLLWDQKKKELLCLVSESFTGMKENIFWYKGYCINKVTSAHIWSHSRHAHMHMDTHEHVFIHTHVYAHTHTHTAQLCKAAKRS